MAKKKKSPNPAGRSPAARRQRRQRRAEVAGHIARGTFDSKELAKKWNVASRTIQLDAEWLEDQWIREAARDLNRARLRQIRGIAKVREEAWAAWERSKEKRHKVQRKTKGDGEGDEVTTTVEESIGDQRFLATVLKTFDQEAELTGTKLLKVAPVGPDGEQTYTTAVLGELMGLAERVGQGVSVTDAQYLEEVAQTMLMANEKTGGNPVIDGALGDPAEPARTGGGDQDKDDGEQDSGQPTDAEGSEAPKDDPGGDGQGPGDGEAD